MWVLYLSLLLATCRNSEDLYYVTFSIYKAQHLEGSRFSAKELSASYGPMPWKVP